MRPQLVRSRLTVKLLSLGTLGAILVSGCSSAAGSRQVGPSTTAGSRGPAGGPVDPDRDLPAEVANYVRWHVVQQQQALSPDLETLGRWLLRQNRLKSNMSVLFNNGPHVTVGLRVEAGYVTSTRQEIARLTHASEFNVAAYTSGIRTLLKIYNSLGGVTGRATETRITTEPGAVTGYGRGAHFITINLRADQENLAARLYDMWGPENVRIALGALPYPLVHAGFVSDERLAAAMYSGTAGPAVLSGGCASEPMPDAPTTTEATSPVPNLPSTVTATVRVPTTPSGQDITATIHLTNHGTTAFAYDQRIFGSLVTPVRRTGVAGFIGAVTAEGIPPGSLAPGTSVDLIARTSTAGCSYAIGYAVPPGHYEFVASVGIDGSKVPKPALGKPTPVPESAEWWVVGPVTVR